MQPVRVADGRQSHLFPLSPKTLTQPNLFDRLLELLGVSIQAGDDTFPAAGTAATSSSLGKAVRNSIHDSIGPRWQTATRSPGRDDSPPGAPLETFWHHRDQDKRRPSLPSARHRPDRDCGRHRLPDENPAFAPILL